MRKPLYSMAYFDAPSTTNDKKYCVALENAIHEKLEENSLRVNGRSKEFEWFEIFDAFGRYVVDDNVNYVKQLAEDGVEWIVNPEDGSVTCKLPEINDDNSDDSDDDTDANGNDDDEDDDEDEDADDHDGVGAHVSCPISQSSISRRQCKAQALASCNTVDKGVVNAILAIISNNISVFGKVIRILWIGCKSCAPAQFLFWSLLVKYNQSHEIAMVVLEDIRSIENYGIQADVSPNSFDVRNEDFLHFSDSNTHHLTFFDVMYSSVVASFSTAFKLKFHIIAFEQYRLELIMIGCDALFKDDDKKLFPTKLISTNVECEGADINYFIAPRDYKSAEGESSNKYWGNPRSGHGISLIKRLKTEIDAQIRIVWIPKKKCLNFYKLFYENGLQSPKKKRVTFLSRTFVLTFNAAFGEALSKQDPAGDHFIEIVQVCYFQVILLYVFRFLK
jgi:hypothetical protein